MELFVTLATDLGLDFKQQNSADSDLAGLSAAKYASIFPDLVISRRGSPESGGGTWIHPDLVKDLMIAKGYR